MFDSFQVLYFYVGCQYQYIMEPISQLYCDPFEFTDQDAKIIMFGCGLIYPVTEPAVDIQWFIDQGSGLQ